MTTGEVDQDYIDEAASQLEYFVQETGRMLNEYVKGNATEEDLKHVAGKAVDAYEEAEDRIDEATKQMQEHDKFAEFRSEIQDAGYNNVREFVMGSKPARASGKDPERQVLDSITGSDFVDTEDAYKLQRDYSEIARNANMHFDVEIPLPELDEYGEELIEHWEKVEELMERKGISSEEAADRIDF